MPINVNGKCEIYMPHREGCRQLRLNRKLLCQLPHTANAHTQHTAAPQHPVLVKGGIRIPCPTLL